MRLSHLLPLTKVHIQRINQKITRTFPTISPFYHTKRFLMTSCTIQNLCKYCWTKDAFILSFSILIFGCVKHLQPYKYFTKQLDCSLEVTYHLQLQSYWIFHPHIQLSKHGEIWNKLIQWERNHTSWESKDFYVVQLASLCSSAKKTKDCPIIKENEE